ncbi:MAG TPA: hypothetical protein VML50_05755 [Anaeromyxobacter sp.]|nr:hypothetical protein [Anaeromyxobacter sp.]
MVALLRPASAVSAQLAAALLWAAALPGSEAAAAEPLLAGTAAPGPGAADDWSVLVHITVGKGWEWVTPRPPDAIAAGVELLVRKGAFAAGPFLDGGGGSSHDSGWYGVAAGAVLDPLPWARLELLAEGGLHDVGVESAYAGLPGDRASLAFLGARAGLYAYTQLMPSAALAWAKRSGFGLQVGGRVDLAHATLRAGVPPELGQPVPERAGGGALAITFVLVLEW